MIFSTRKMKKHTRVEPLSLRPHADKDGSSSTGACAAGKRGRCALPVPGVPGRFARGAQRYGPTLPFASLRAELRMRCSRAEAGPSAPAGRPLTSGFLPQRAGTRCCDCAAGASSTSARPPTGRFCLRMRSRRTAASAATTRWSKCAQRAGASG